MKVKRYKIVSIKAAILSIIILTGCFFSACQATPGKTVVINKGDADLKENIQKTAALSEVSTKSEKRWTYEKDYDSGNRVIVDAVMYYTDADKLPVLSVTPKMFESGVQLKKIVDVFCPDAKIYDQGDKLTKSQLTKSILDIKEEIFRVEHDMIPFEGAKEPIPEDRKENYLNGLYSAIEYYEQQMETAPDDSELKEAGYQLTDVGNGILQSNMLAIADDAAFFIDYINNPPDRIGSEFYLESSKLILENMGISDKFVIPESLESDSEYIKTKQRIDQCVKSMGIDYMSLNSVSRGEDSYSFYYTRAYYGLQETYVNEHIGTTVTGVDFGPMIYLWKPEYLCLEVLNDEIVKVTWDNPSEIISVDNENVQIKFWEEIQEIFKKQMDFLMSPKPAGNGDKTNPLSFLRKRMFISIVLNLGSQSCL